MATEEKDKKTNWPEWIKERIGGNAGDAPQKANLKHGRIAWCMAFDRGDQYKILNEQTGVVEDVYMTRETRCIYNFIKTFNDAYAAKMWKGNPFPVTTPFSTNTEDYDEDVNVATNAEVEYWWKTDARGPINLYDITRTAAVGGIGVAKIYYDKNAKSGMYLGKSVLEQVNPLHFFPNADATCDDEIREVNHRYPLEKEVAEERWAEQIKALGIKELSPETKDDAHPEIVQANKNLDNMRSAETKATVIVNDIWIKACKKYPLKWVGEKDEMGADVLDEKKNPKGKFIGGKHVIVIGENTLVEEDNPDPDMVPFFTYPVNPVAGDLYGIGVTYPIMPNQRDANKASSVMAENLDYMGHLKWLVKAGTVENPSAFDEMSGEIIEHTGDVPPRQSEANPLPNYITGRFWEQIEIAKFNTHIQDLGLGMIPDKGSQMASATTRELTNAEVVMFAPDVARMSEFVGKIVNRHLYHVKNYYPEDRIVTIIGENKRPEAIAFKRENIADNYNVDIKVGSGFDRSDEAKVTAITNLMQTPAFDKAGVDPRMIMEELLKKQGLTKLYEDTFRDERQAKRYLDFIITNPGVEYPINRFVNPMAHIKVFTNFTKLAEFDALHPVVRGTIEGYIDRMIEMTTPPAPPPSDMQGMPGNENPVVGNPNEAPNLGGRPPMGINEEPASQMAPEGV